MNAISFAIIGGGPAGFYTAKLLSKLPCNPIIHIYEKQICPFGLIRYGVAPDHISIKKMEHNLSSISTYPNFQYIGNQNITPSYFNHLVNTYSGIVYAFGASGSNIPKWMPSKYPASVKLAQQIVYWYNNHPRYEQYHLNLDNIRNVTIIGNGNVSIDISRIFLRNPKDLEQSQISINALKSLYDSSIRNITIVGRRGLTHSAFSLKEVRDLRNYQIQLYAIIEQLQNSMNEASYIQSTAIGSHFNAQARINKRKIDFIKKQFHLIQLHQLERVLAKDSKKVIFRFLLNPIQLKSPNSLLLNSVKLQGLPFRQAGVDISQSTFEHQFDMLVISTGFEVQPTINPYHYDSANMRVSNSNGCVIRDDKIDIGKYTVGWCKSGPKGVIDSTLLSCQETFNNIRIHYQNNLLTSKPTPTINRQNTINFQQYLKVKEIQFSRGIKDKSIRRKLCEKQIRQICGI